MGAKDRLHSKIDRLADEEAGVVERVVDAELVPIQSWHLQESWLATDSWSAAFAARLRAHHALNPEPLGSTTFEAAFGGACEVAGYRVVPTPSATHRFFDTTVTPLDGQPRTISLKSSSAQDMRPGRVHISKLTEAAWIQDARRQRDRRDLLTGLFRRLRRVTDVILMLRAFPADDGGYRYELVEIDTDLFADLDDLTIEEAQHGTINRPPETTFRDRTYAVRVDGSDAKITVTGIDINACTVHGEWHIPDLFGPTEDHE